MATPTELMASPNFRWMEGMRNQYGDRMTMTTHLTETGGVKTEIGYVRGNYSDLGSMEFILPSGYPDFGDGATRGAMLSLARKLWDTNYLIPAVTQGNDGRKTWQLLVELPGVYEVYYGDTEGEVIADAIIAARARRG